MTTGNISALQAKIAAAQAQIEATKNHSPSSISKVKVPSWVGQQRTTDSAPPPVASPDPVEDGYDDDEDVEYVEEIEYVDDTDEEGSYIVEEYVDEEEVVEDEEGAGNIDHEPPASHYRNNEEVAEHQVLPALPPTVIECAIPQEEAVSSHVEQPQHDEFHVQPLEEDLVECNPPANEISYQGMHASHSSSLHHPEPDDDEEEEDDCASDDEVEEKGEQEDEEEVDSEVLASPANLQNNDAPVVQEEAAEPKESVLDEATPIEAEKSVAEPTADSSPEQESEPTTPTGGKRPLFQRRKSFGSQKSGGGGGSFKGGLTRSGSSKSIGSSKSLQRLGKGLKKVFGRGKGNKSKDDKGEVAEAELTESFAQATEEPVEAQPLTCTEAVVVDTAPALEQNESHHSHASEAADEVIVLDDAAANAEVPSTVQPSPTTQIETAKVLPTPPTTPLVATESVQTSSSTITAQNTNTRDTPPVSPSRWGKKKAVAAAVGGTTTETTTTSITTTTTVTQRVMTPAIEQLDTTTGHDDVQYSYSKDGRTYYTNKLEKAEKLGWKKPEWTSKSPLRTTRKGAVLKEVGDLAKPITFPVGQGDGINRVVQPDEVLKYKGEQEEKTIEWKKPSWTKEPVLKPTGKSEVLKAGALEKPIVIPADKSVEAETGIGWTKPSWTKQSVLKSTDKGSALKSGAEIARPITAHTNQV